MFKYFNFLFLVSSSLASLNFAQAGTIDLQLLIDDEDLSYAQYVTRVSHLDYANKIPHPHVSFLRIDDSQGIIQKNFPDFVTGLNSLLEMEASLQFIGQSVKGYESKNTGVMYWCIEDADKTQPINPPNARLKSIGESAKKFVVNFMNAHKEPKPFSLKSPDELVADTKAATAKIEESYVEYAKGFPHVSIGKGHDLTENTFSGAKNKQIIMNIKGFKSVLTYSKDQVVRLPQLYVSKYFNDPRYELISGFDALKPYHNLYPNINSLLQTIKGFDLVEQEIAQKSQPVQPKRNAAGVALGGSSLKRIKLEEQSPSMNANPLVSGPAVQKKDNAKQGEVETLKKKIEIIELRKKLAALTKPNNAGQTQTSMTLKRKADTTED